MNNNLSFSQEVYLLMMSIKQCIFSDKGMSVVRIKNFIYNNFEHKNEDLFIFCIDNDIISI